ncbi:hypothetical protein [Actinoplanes sp. NBRC 103695]|uniref:hypothetical protein n=1 Tax=Actinoplanes sp. NBRC 103695 TaxID=3032202 RepID=UPI0024A1EAC5|nr:hypothetical protein [Actinoplanes sp. NBRC 103695]GLZ01353.1 hypothetical protein Acsp02_86040 [Actinoplanes sp. NBRC 103695]
MTSYPDVAAAEHGIATSDPAPAAAYTLMARSPRPHVAVVTEPSEGARAVRYPGVDALTGSLPVSEVLSLSAINRVEILGGGDADPALILDTGDFVRPRWRADALVLTVMPATPGHVVPFETRDPTPCCAVH